jgi:hypothetical protein
MVLLALPKIIYNCRHFFLTRAKITDGNSKAAARSCFSYYGTKNATRLKRTATQ